MIFICLSNTSLIPLWLGAFNQLSLASNSFGQLLILLYPLYLGWIMRRMPWIDGSASAHPRNETGRFLGQLLVAIRQVGHNFDARNESIASEDDVITNPCDAAWCVSWRGNSLQRHTLIQFNHITIGDCLYLIRIVENKWCAMIERQIQLIVQQLFPAPVAAVDRRLWISLNQIIKPINVVKMTMREQDSPQKSAMPVNQLPQRLHIPHIDHPCPIHHIRARPKQRIDHPVNHLAPNYSVM